ncbi:MAG: glycosyltransferase family 2 protein [bacterium]|nr:glycosyltransferase family 2 protein [bacterium]
MGASFSVGIPCYGHNAELTNLLCSLAQFGFREVLVVDDGSPVPVRLDHPHASVRVIRHSNNLGVAAARNRIIHDATGDVVLFLDADVVVESCSVPRLMDAVLADTVAAVTGHVVEPCTEGLPNRWRSWFWRQDHGTRPGEVDLAYGLCCAWRRDVVRDLGGFDERLVSHAEDVDLSLRARAARWRIRHEPGLVVRHLRRDSVKSLLQMIWKHSFHYSRVCRWHNNPDYARALWHAVRWLPVSVWSSLVRHRDPAMALFSIPCCVDSIIARITAGAFPRHGL